MIYYIENYVTSGLDNRCDWTYNNDDGVIIQ